MTVTEEHRAEAWPPRKGIQPRIHSSQSPFHIYTGLPLYRETTWEQYVGAEGTWRGMITNLVTWTTAWETNSKDRSFFLLLYFYTAHHTGVAASSAHTASEDNSSCILLFVFPDNRGRATEINFQCSACLSEQHRDIDSRCWVGINVTRPDIQMKQMPAEMPHTVNKHKPTSGGSLQEIKRALPRLAPPVFKTQKCFCCCIHYFSVSG